jgi:LysM repeat protein
MKHKIIIVLAALLVVAPLLWIGAQTAQAQSYVTLVVQRGDTLSKLARAYCTSWQEIYNINRQAIGPNPNTLEPGTVLTVPDRCGNSGNPGGVYDRGPRTGATGSFYAPTYTVAWGDNLNAIAARFGVSVDAIRQVNDMWGDTVWVGMTLTIPGTVGIVPPIQPSVERVQFAPGSVSASRSGTTTWGVPMTYVLSARAGQQMEVYTASHGDPLALSMTGPYNTVVTLNGVNYDVQNSVWATLPYSGDYYVKVQTAVIPEGPSLPFDITFVIR